MILSSFVFDLQPVNLILRMLNSASTPFIIPMTIHNGLPRLSIRPPTTHEFDTLPHVVLTQDSTWDPTVLDFDIEDTDDNWHDALEEHELHPYHQLFDEYGNYKGRVTAQFSQTIMRSTDHEFENFVDHCIAHVHQLSPNPLLDIKTF